MSNTADGATRITIVDPMQPGAIKALLDLMPRCRDCRWWEKAIYVPPCFDERNGYGECAKARARGGADPDTLACAFESNFWSADLITAGSYGCVQFEAKDS